MMTTLFPAGISFGMTAMLAIQFLSLAAMVIGLLSYRHIIRNHLAFFGSLHHAGKQARQKPMRILFWLYLLSTLLITFLTLSFFILQPRLS